MKAFFEEYGFLLVSALVVVVLIGIASVLGPNIKEYITGLAESFNTMGSGWATAAKSTADTAIGITG